MRFIRSDAFGIAIGLAVGQGVVLIATPFLTRLYGPEHFGVLTLFITVATIAAVLGTLRLEVLIPGADESDVPALSLTAILTVTVTGIFLAVSGFHFMGQSPELMALLGFVIIAIGAGAVLLQIAARVQQYRQLAASKAALGIVQVAIQSTLGLARFSGSGLIWGAFAGYCASLLIQYLGLRKAAVLKAMWVLRFDLARQLRIVRQALPLVLASVANVMSTSMLVLATSAYAGAEATGQLGVAQRVALIPAGLAVASIGPVIAGAVGRAVRNGEDDSPAVKQWLVRLVPFGIFAGGLMLAFRYLPASALFGDEWSDLALYFAALAPSVAMQILAGPFSQVLIVRGRVRVQLVWEIVRLLLVVAALLGAFMTASSAVVFVAVGSLALAFGYALQVVLVLRCGNLRRSI